MRRATDLTRSGGIWLAASAPRDELRRGHRTRLYGAFSPYRSGSVKRGTQAHSIGSVASWAAEPCNFLP